MTTANSWAEPLFPQPLLEALAARPDEIAIEHGSRAVSCGELLATVGHLVGRLRAFGLGPGRGVAIATAVTPEAFALHVAAHALGCRVVGVRPGWSPQALASVLTGEVDALVGDPSTLTPTLVGLARPAAALSLGPFPDAVDLLGSAARTATPTADDLIEPGGSGDRPQADPTAKEAATADDRVERVSTAGRPHADWGDAIVVEARGDDIARLNFTSGSTGLPKACARTYRTFSLLFRADRWAPDLARLVAACRRFLAYGSWSIPVMFTFAGRCLITGGTVVISDEGLRPDLARAVARHRITGVAMTVPSLHQLLGRLDDDLGSLRALIVTGSPASPSLLVTAVDRLGPVVWQGYGQAESGMISLLTPDDVARHPETALTSVGRPLPEVEIHVRRPDGGRAAPGEAGEICVRSPHLMTGYWGDPEATREVLVDGWLRTRDLGHVDEATGLLHLTGRSRDVIIVNGEVCYAGAIEQILVGHPDVAQAYVVGVPDDRTGEAVHAFVVPPPDGAAPDREARAQLTDLVRSELNANHVPETITVLRQVPVAAGGKPDKQALVGLVRSRPVSSR